MQKHRIRFGSEGDPSLLVLSLNGDQTASTEPLETCAVPLFARQGGLLLAVPDGTLADGLFVSEEDFGSDALFGPGDSFNSTLFEDGDEGLVSVGLEASVQVFDVSDTILAAVREYDPVTDSTQPIKPFHATASHTFPCGDVFLSRIRECMKTLADGGSLFYSAQEDLVTPAAKTTAPAVATKKAAAPKRVSQASLMEKLDAIAGQVQFLMNRQDQLEERQSKASTAEGVSGPLVSSGKTLPAVSAGLDGGMALGGTMGAVTKAMGMVGPPPKHRDPKLPAAMVGSAMTPPATVPAAIAAPSGSSWEAALVEQSSALTSLVAHLASQSPDSLGELNFGSSSSQTSGTRGVLRREKLQADLASRSGGFYLQLMQQMHRRLHPGKPVPASLAELQSLSMLTYLERQGGFRGQREAGLMMWLLGHIVDSINAEDWAGVRELTALTVVALEQSVVDQGDWSLAFLLSLASEPPVQMFQDRVLQISPHGRPFAPLCPAQWAATTLGYLKDLETLSSKKTEIVPKAKTTPKPSSPSPENPSPKRKPRYPKKVRPQEEDA